MTQDYKLNIGDRVYFIVKSDLYKDNHYEVLYADISRIIPEGGENPTIYVVEYGGDELWLDCNGFKGKERFCSLITISPKTNTITNYGLCGHEKFPTGHFHTTIENVLDEYEQLLSDKVREHAIRIQRLNEECGVLRMYRYKPERILSGVEYLGKLNEVNKASEVTTSLCCPSE